MMEAERNVIRICVIQCVDSYRNIKCVIRHREVSSLMLQLFPLTQCIMGAVRGAEGCSLLIEVFYT